MKMIHQKVIDGCFSLFIIDEQTLIFRAGAAADIFKSGAAPICFALGFRSDA